MGCNLSLEVLSVTQSAWQLRAVSMSPYWLPPLRFDKNIYSRDSKPSALKRSLYHKKINFAQTWMTCLHKYTCHVCSNIIDIPVQL